MGINFNQIRKNIKKQELKERVENIIPRQIGLIENVLEIIKTQLSDVHYVGFNNVASNDLDELQRVTILDTKRRFFEFFYNVTKFLFEKIKTEKRENFRFYLPNIRTLLDIYSKLLYLANLNYDDQASNCICEQLNYLKTFLIEDEFEKTYKYYKLLIDARNYQIPSYNDFSKKSINKYLFPHTEQMIKSEYINKFKPNGFRTDTGLTDLLYNKMYRYLSGYAHGHILNKDFYGNEDLWIIRNILYLSSLIIKLIDIDMLDNKNDKEIEKWVYNLIKMEPDFNKFYIKKRAKK